ncbi:hypothetical protein PG993_007539 [Apiospora rasikravindrae]|uniref:Uncharacterized protein n=1 Tax=Apiospora rasikravindrae TaxID=990691 RepID=A0ABR1SXT2_9PEZI
MAQQQQQQHLPATAAYQNEWPVYPAFKWGHQLCPSPHQRPFAPFRNCREPIPPPRRKTTAELAHEAREQAWRDRQNYLTNLSGRELPSVISELELDSDSSLQSQSESQSESDQEVQEEQEQRQQQPSHHLESMAIESLSTIRNFILKALDVIAALLDWFYHLVIILAVAILLISAFLDPAKYLFRRLMLLFLDDAEPNEFRYVLVQDYRSWSVAQPC